MPNLKEFWNARVVLNLWSHEDVKKMMKEILKGAGAKVTCQGIDDIPYQDRGGVDIIIFDFAEGSALERDIKDAIWVKLYIFYTYYPQAVTIAVVDENRVVEGRNISEIAAEPTSKLPQYAYTADGVMAIPKRPRKRGVRRKLYKQVIPLLIGKQARNAERAAKERGKKVAEAIEMVQENQAFSRERG